jgi:hypothetical protein
MPKRVSVSERFAFFDSSHALHVKFAMRGEDARTIPVYKWAREFEQELAGSGRYFGTVDLKLLGVQES